MATTAYLTVEEAAAILSERLNISPWTEATYADKLKALKMATQIINKFRYISTKYAETQANEFPRGVATTPDEILTACALIAMSLLDGYDSEIEKMNLNVSGETISSIKTTYERSFAPEHVVHGVPNAEAWSLMSKYMEDGRTVDVTRVS